MYRPWRVSAHTLGASFALIYEIILFSSTRLTSFCLYWLEWVRVNPKHAWHVLKQPVTFASAVEADAKTEMLLQVWLLLYNATGSSSKVVLGHANNLSGSSRTMQQACVQAEFFGICAFRYYHSARMLFFWVMQLRQSLGEANNTSLPKWSHSKTFGCKAFHWYNIYYMYYRKVHNCVELAASSFMHQDVYLLIQDFRILPALKVCCRECITVTP